ncbi:FAD-dependent monooxygenase [Acinetobacter sp. MD2]|uniref:FAD-dependent monooxygenase n=1 Tax=Acinetobacter sp. MD2 TaxID=2600066 RepID=UPI002D1F2307|nr:FAD-dependent monooxygenase [Acinetobacter sp. MD2]MEB3766360.1 FAD-dependent monooxygenase [Acinetobacter sp. MD2]
MSKKALIVGLGIAGMATAIALKKKGWEPMIIERAAERRTGGYFIGLQGAGKEAAAKLGVLPDIHVRTPMESRNWDLLDDGSRIRVAGFADQLTKPAVLLRGDIEEGLWINIEKQQIEVRYNLIPTAIQDLGEKVNVTFKHASDDASFDEQFDLVVGCDGLRSTVRKLAFGPHEQYIQYMGSMICAYQLKKSIKNFVEHDGIMSVQPEKSLWIFPLADHPNTALFAYRCKDPDSQFKQKPSETLKALYADMPNQEIVQQALEDLETSKDYLFDSVNTVNMERWSKGRVVLVGDAAWCLTLYSGMGAGTAIDGGYELAEAISAHEDISIALEKWEKKMRPLIRKHRLLVPLKAQVFCPANPTVSLLRRLVLRIGGRQIVRINR